MSEEVDGVSSLEVTKAPRLKRLGSVQSSGSFNAATLAPPPVRMTAAQLAAMEEANQDLGMDGPAVFKMPGKIQKIGSDVRKSAETKRASTAWSQGKETVRASLARGDNLTASKLLRQSAAYSLLEISNSISQQQQQQDILLKTNIRESFRVATGGASGGAGGIGQGLNLKMLEEIYERCDKLQELLNQKDDDLKLAAEIGAQLVEQAQSTEQQLEELAESYTELQREFQIAEQSHNSEIVSLRAELQNWKFQQEEMHTEIEELADLNKNYEEDIHRLQAERQRLVGQLSEIQTLKHKAQLYEQSKSENEELADIIVQLEEEAEQSKLTLKQLEDANEESQKEIKELTSQVDSLEQAQEEMEEKYKDKIEQLKERISELEAILERADMEGGITSSRIQAQHHPISHTNANDESSHSFHANDDRIKLLADENLRLSELYESEKKKSSQLNKELSDQTKTFQSMKQELQTAKLRIQELETKFLEKENIFLQSELEKQQKIKEAERLKEELNKYKKTQESLISGLQEKNRTLEEELLVEKDSKIKLENENVKLKKVNEDLSQSKKTLEKIIEELKGMSTDMSQLTNLKLMVESLKSENQSLVEQRDIAESKLITIKATYQTRIDDLIKQLEAAQKRAAEAIADKNAINGRGDTNNYVLEELEKVRKERDQLQIELQEALNALGVMKSKQAKNAKLRETRRIATQDVSGIQIMNQLTDELKMQIDKQAEEIRALKAENRKLREENERLEFELASQPKVKKIDSSLPAPISDELDKIAKIEELKAECKRLEEQIKLLEETVDLLTDKLKQTENDLEETKIDLSAYVDGSTTAMQHLQNQLVNIREERNELQSQVQLLTRNHEKYKAQKQRTTENLKQTISRLHAENQKWCDCVVAQFESHRQIFKTSIAPPTPRMVTT
eukprot:c20370_g1_i1.p1 GENE.c20370_g1_i1~~c20370_g1_i1.p1  ORF type:complete len:913 (+),score=465.11 c20370_g1_i1:101-2839(+)